MASGPSVSSLAIRAPPSLNSSDEEREEEFLVKKNKKEASSSSSSSSSSESFHSGAEEDFETASERPFVVDPDDEILEEAGSETVAVAPVVGFSAVRSMMPIARVSGGDDDGRATVDVGFAGDGSDDGVSGVARVPATKSQQKDSVLGDGGKEGDLEDRVVVDSEAMKEAVFVSPENSRPKAVSILPEKSISVAVSASPENPVVVGKGSVAERRSREAEYLVRSYSDLWSGFKGKIVAAGESVDVKDAGAVVSEKSVESAAAEAVGVPESDSSEKLVTKEVEKSNEMVGGSDQVGTFVEELENSKHIGADSSIEDEKKAVVTDASEKQVASIVLLSNSNEIGSGTEQLGRFVEEAKAGIGGVAAKCEAAGDGGSDKNLEAVTMEAVETASESDSHVKVGFQELEPAFTDSVAKSNEIGSGSDYMGNGIGEAATESKSVDGGDNTDKASGYGSADKTLETVTAAVVETNLQSGSHEKPEPKELEPVSTDLSAKSDETGSGSSQVGNAVGKAAANLEPVEEEINSVGNGNDLVDYGSSDKIPEAVNLAAIKATSQSEKAGLEELEPVPADSTVKFSEISSGSEHAGNITGDVAPVEAVITGVVEKDGSSDKNLGTVAPPEINTTPQPTSHETAGFEESKPAPTDSVAISSEKRSGSDQVAPVVEAVDSKSVGREKDEAFAAVYEIPQPDSHKNAEFEESKGPSIDSGAKPNELVSEIGNNDHDRYEAPTMATSIDNKSLVTNLDKEGQLLVIGDSKDQATDKEILKSSGGTPIFDTSVNALNDNSRDDVPRATDIPARDILMETSGPVSVDLKVKQDNENSRVEDEEEDGSETVERIIREIEKGSSSSQLESSRDFPQKIGGQIVSDSDEEAETDGEGEGKELFDSAALAALLKAASNAGPDGHVTLTVPEAARLFSSERPAGLGSSVPSLRPTPARSNRPTIFTPSDPAVAGESDNNMDEEEKKLHEKIQQIRVKFLRLVHRLGHTPEDTVAAQVLYRLGLAEGIRRGQMTNRAFSLENARKTAVQLETAGKDDLDFSCNILILGKTGVGKSATVNSIFGEVRTPISAFEPATSSVKEITGTVDGVKICVIDTPGLKTSLMDQNSNRKILSSIKKYTKKCPPDIVLYIDRLDTQPRDLNDLPLLRSICGILGPSIWLNAIVALTHAASAPPDGPNGTPLSYEMFVAQRSHTVQHSIRQAAGDMRLMNPVALVENHPSCRRNREGERVLPNGQNWRPQLLLLCYSSKILSEANSLLKLQDPSSTGKLFGFRIRSPPLPFLLSSLLQSRPHPKLSSDMGGESIDSDIDLDELSDSEREEEEDEYDQLPPFKPLKKSQLEKLSKEQKKAYFDEYDYRVKLLQKKQWKEELRRLRESKKRGKGGQDDVRNGDMGEDYDQENGGPAAVPVALPDMVLPPSFDGDNPTYRYRFLEPTSQLLARPVLDTHGWDHDCGYDGVSLEENLTIISKFPAAVSVQITKDKKEFNFHLDSSVSAKHGENGSTMAGFDIQSIGKQLAYILRGETKFQNFKKNKTAAGVSITFLGENVATGLKIEDQISIGKRLSVVGSTGAVRSQGDTAYGANLEMRLREKDFPIGQDQSTLGLSLMRWRGDLALGANLQSQFSIGRNSKMAVRLGLNNKMSGQITVRTSSTEQLQIALMGVIPLVAAFIRTIRPDDHEHPIDGLETERSRANNG